MEVGAQGLAQTNYLVRSAAFAYLFVVLAVVLWECGAPPLAWGLMVFQFLVYPHLVYWRARLSPRPTRAELDNLFLDAALLAAWCAALGFPTWLTFGVVSATTLNAVVNRGLQGLAWSVTCSVGGAVLWILVRGLHYAPQTSDLVTTLCILGVFAYVAMVGAVVHAQNRRLAATRDALRRSEESFRLIAEHAADLIGMVDGEGRWLYTSPSYERILEPDDLAAGTNAFRKVHPEDADAVLTAVLRSSVTAKPRDLTMRIADKEGRVRQYKTRIQALAGNGGRRVLLVSQDVTDLRDSEERVSLAAKALETLTQAVVITGADGTVFSVNRAFTELTGFTREEVVGQSEKSIRNAMQAPAYYDEIYAAVLRDDYWSGTTWARRKNGTVYREWRMVRAVRDANGSITYYMMVFSEVGAGPYPSIDITSPNPLLRG